MTRVYLASQYLRRDELRNYAAALRAHGYEITSRWIEGEHKPLRDLASDSRDAQAAATRDLEDVRAADVHVAFTEPRDTSQRGRGGRHVEFGVALAGGQRLVVVGPAEHVFHLLAQVERYNDWDEALHALTASTPRVGTA
jgi:hypothetical protein